MYKPVRANLLRSLAVLPPRPRLTVEFALRQGYIPRLNPPRTFSEKIVARKLGPRDLRFSALADKLQVREYVAKRVGAEHLSKLLGLFDHAADLDLANLPSRFVAKATHDQGSVRLVEAIDPTVVESLRQHFTTRLGTICGVRQHAWWYWPIPPRILIEEHLSQPGEPSPMDYKFFVFHGRAEMIQVDLDRFGTHRRNLYSPSWEPLPGYLMHTNGNPVERPHNLDEMIWVAEALGSDIDFVRVDLYSLPNRAPIFGEMTFAPGSGYERFSPRSLDFWLGSLW